MTHFSTYNFSSHIYTKPEFANNKPTHTLIHKQADILGSNCL